MYPDCIVDDVTLHFAVYKYAIRSSVVSPCLPVNLLVTLAFLPMLPVIYMSTAGLKLALIQLAVGADKSVNVSRACEFISQAAKAGAQLIALPVCTVQASTTSPWLSLGL